MIGPEKRGTGSLRVWLLTKRWVIVTLSQIDSLDIGLNIFERRRREVRKPAIPKIEDSPTLGIRSNINYVNHNLDAKDNIFLKRSICISYIVFERRSQQQVDKEKKQRKLRIGRIPTYILKQRRVEKSLQEFREQEEEERKAELARKLFPMDESERLALQFSLKERFNTINSQYQMHTIHAKLEGNRLKKYQYSLEK